ncbi:hypothetical protein [Accumulibacter sp.]|uniref:hypothetical protein n=1 Tax=Accumulibacter sp. TaxID=2053492 RepID=UPI0025F4F503|nr:hypothetical protein [Accumulibacter sp.]MCM8613894.1 hypothetical protein [Accumulibacter sp.]MCM8637719.1 hypothetical protein [Accumulibacter sp.]MCM8641067.1 hypothetical protein [Accumulibacter sp.]
MALPLTPNIAKAVEKLYPPHEVDEVVRLLTEECADNLPNCQSSDEYALEDLRFAVLELSAGNIEKLRQVVRMANEDWRDVLWEAGSTRRYQRTLLGSSWQLNVKTRAASHARYWNRLAIIAAFALSFVLIVSGAPPQHLLGTGVMVGVVYAAGRHLLLRPLGPPHEGAAMLLKMTLIVLLGSGALGYVAAMIIRPFL